MGNQCGSDCGMDDVDNLNGVRMYTNVTPQTEVFQEGALPKVNQDPHRFDDDDPIEVVRSDSRYQQNVGMLKYEKYELEKNVQLEVKATGLQGNSLALLISVLTKEVEVVDPFRGVNTRKGIDLICVVDHSGSMQGQKIKLVRQTLRHMLEFLQPQDRLSLIMFDCKDYRLTRLMRVTEENKSKFKIAIHCIQAQGGTDIENGMRMAFSTIKHRRYANPVTAVFLLSDGEDFEAEERVATLVRRMNIRDTFTIKTFGFGRDVCPKIMHEIAHLKEGQFYFVPDLTNIDECFVEALGGLISVVANNVQISVQPHNSGSTKIRKAYGDKWQYDSWNKVHTLYQPHLLSGVRKDFVFEMDVPSFSQKLSVLVTLQLESIDGGPPILIKHEVVLNDILANDQNEVQANLLRVRGAECFNQALLHAENGNLNRGQKLLDDALAQMYSDKSDDPQLDLIRRDMEMAKDCCQPMRYQQEGRHHLTQLHVVHMYQKSRGVQIYEKDQYGKVMEIDCTYQNNVQKQFKDQTRQMKQQGSIGCYSSKPQYNQLQQQWNNQPQQQQFQPQTQYNYPMEWQMKQLGYNK